FALAAPDAAAQIAAWFGPWAVSGPAIAIGEVALKDVAWMQAAREVLACSASRLDAVLTRPALNVVGGTLLFPALPTKNARGIVQRAGTRGHPGAPLRRATDLDTVRAPTRRGSVEADCVSACLISRGGRALGGSVGRKRLDIWARQGASW